MREVKILRHLVHPHIIRLLEAIETKSRIYVVMEYMDHGELFDYIMQKRKIEENQARLFFQQVDTGMSSRNFINLNPFLFQRQVILDSKSIGSTIFSSLYVHFISWFLILFLLMKDLFIEKVFHWDV